MNMIRSKIQAYLYMGYVPPNTFPGWLDDCFEQVSAGYRYDAADVSRLLDTVMDDSCARVSGTGYCIVPISGGWDSRIILGALLQRFEAGRIKTLTFGVPGQLDFEIGREVSRAMNVEHSAFDLSTLEISWDVLLESVRESPWTYVPDTFYNRMSIRRIASADDTVFTGFLGGALTGSHFSKAVTQEQAKAAFIKKQRRGMKLNAAGYAPAKIISPLPVGSAISYGELFELGIRQARCIAPIVTPQKQWVQWGCDFGKIPSLGADVIAPFASPEWAAYWLRAPKKAKHGQQLYRAMMKHKFPRLAAMRGKHILGVKPSSVARFWFEKNRFRVQKRIDAMIPRLKFGSRILHNYLDFASAFREREDFQLILQKAYNFLVQTEVVPWLNLEKLKAEHMSFKANHEASFLLLIGLALNLQAENAGKQLS